jgi:hypothetical protein
MNGQDVLTEFYAEEVALAAGYQTSAQVLSVHQAKRLREYLALILDDYRAASTALIKHLEKEREVFGTGPLGLNPERRRLLEKSEHLQTIVHLRIETFYVFAKMMLDKLAHTLEIHFGSARGIPIHKHSKLVTKLSDYAAAQGLVPPAAQLIEAAERAEAEIGAFRDRHVVHEWNPRRRWATGINRETGDTSLSAWIVSKKPTDAPPLTGAAPPKLMETLDSYVIELVRYIAANRPGAPGT